MIDDPQQAPDPQLEAAFQQAQMPNRQPAAAMPMPQPMADVGPINVINPEGKLVSIPAEQLQSAMDAGYQQATDEHVHAYLNEQKYGSVGQQIKTGLEGAAEATTFGLSTAAEKAFGAKDEDIQGRRETNPGVHALGQATGLVASMFTGEGEAALLGKAAQAGVDALGLANAVSTTAKIGSAAVKGVIENAGVQFGDEISKRISNDPHQSAETAAADIGLSSLIGGATSGAFGAISPLWKAANGSKTGSILKAVVDHAGGIDGAPAGATDTLIRDAGLEGRISPVMKAALHDNPSVRDTFQMLQESGSGSGLEAQRVLKEFKGQTSEALVNALGRTAEDVGSLEHLSAYDAGVNIKDALVKELKQKIDPISENFAAVKEKFKGLELPKSEIAPSGERAAGTIDKLSENIAQLSQEKGWAKSPGSPEAKLVNRILEELPLQETLEDLRNYQSTIAEEAQRSQMWNFGKEVRKIFRGAEDEVVTKALGGEAPELMNQHMNARAAYREAMTTIDNLNDRLHVGRYSGPESFISALKEMTPEDLVRRTAAKSDVGMQETLGSLFPNAAQAVRQYHLDSILKAGAMRAGEGEIANTKVILTGLEKMSPELRDFVIPKGSTRQIDAIKQLVEQLPQKLNNSGTGRVVNSVLSRVAGSAMGMATMLAGHNPLTAGIVGELTSALGRDIPDAARLGLLKFLGSNRPIESEGFKTMVDYLHHTIRGESLLANATKNVFKAGRMVLPESQFPSDNDRARLDKQLKALQTDPQPLQSVGGKTGHYMPEHAAAMGQFAANAVNYINSQRPNLSPKSPLDTQREPTPAEKSAFNKVLDIAQQPLLVVHRIKDGSVTSKDLMALKSMYPNLYTRLQDKLTEQMTETLTKGESIPYRTRVGLSLFMAQPLDSTMTPASIMAAQPKPPQAQPGTATQPASSPKHSSTALNKLPGTYQTKEQSSEQRAQRAGR